MTSPGTVVGVYRAANAVHVERLVAPALAGGWSTAWWALDSVAPALADVTVGEGAGEKLPLLAETLARHGPMAGTLVLADDDIAFRRGDLSTFVALAAGAGLGLAQPAHAAGSAVSHGITREVRRSRVRLTTFVESGPLVAVAPAWVDRIVPLPVWRGMGWGIELEWMDLAARGVPPRDRRRDAGRAPGRRGAGLRRHRASRPRPRGARGARRGRLGAAAEDPRRLAAVAATASVAGRPTVSLGSAP